MKQASLTTTKWS